MADNPARTAVTGFYEAHPISEMQIMDKMRADGVDLDALTQDVLQNYDQDHYGGTAANDALAHAAGLDRDVRALDICCGLGGPARYMAAKYGCRVTGVDLTSSRVVGARNLSRMTALDGLVDFTVGDALDLPFADQSFDAAYSQEAFGHIPRKDRLISEAVRVVRSGGRIAFTDILATATTTTETRARLSDGMAFNELVTMDEYTTRLESGGCELVGAEDLGAEWREILLKRLKMYRSLEGQTVGRFGQEHFDAWDSIYAFFVDQFRTGELSGGRIVAQKR